MRVTRTTATLRRLGLAALVTAGALAVLAPAAGAGKVIQFSFEDGWTRTFENFCGKPGLTVDYEASVTSSVQIVPRGAQQLEYYLQHGVWRETYTANGLTLIAVTNVVEKDQTITVTPEGLTIVILATGNAVLYGPDGKAIARNPGQVRFLFYVAPNGATTRGDTIKGSTGRSDDFCTAMVAALTG